MQQVHRFFFFLLLVFLPTQLGKHVWPDWTLVLGRRIDYLSPTFYLTDILIVLTLCAWIATHRREIRLPPPPRTRSTLLVAGVVFVVLNIFTALRPEAAIYSWIKVVEYGLLFFYIRRERPSLYFVSTAFAIGIVYSAALGLYQVVAGRALGGVGWFLGERLFTIDTAGIARTNVCVFGSCREVLRAYGTFPHPNVLAGFFTAGLLTHLTVLLGAMYDRLKYSRTHLALSFGTILLAGIGLVSTLSRSSIVAAGVSTVLLISYFRYRHSEGSTKKLNLAVALFVVALLVFFVLSAMPIALRDETVRVRLELAAAAITMWQQHHAFGVGLGNFLIALPGVLVQRGVYFLQPVHNIYLLALSELGIVGIGLVIGMVAMALRIHRPGSGTLTLTPDARALRIAARFILAAMLFIGLFDHYSLTLQQGQLLLVLTLALAL